MAVDMPDFLLRDDDDDMVLASPIRDAEPREAERDARSVSDLDDTTAAEELNSIVNSSLVVNNILNTASNPVSPGPSSPPLEQSKSADFVPPTRPSSTPFPNSEPRDSICCLPSSGYDTDMLQDVEAVPAPVLDPQPVSMTTNLNQLPNEIHEQILDHLFGFRVSATSKSSVAMACVTKSIGTMLRHSRRREVSRLALVSKNWRELIQARLYRHVKIKGTQESLGDAVRFFRGNQRLARYVKHLEIWFPVFQPRNGPLAMGTTLILPLITQDGLGATTYVLPPNNAALRDVFEFASTVLPNVSIVTLEGGERRKAPKVLNSRPPMALQTKVLPQVPSVETLVTKGQWNLMREDDDFQFVMKAFPNLVEWHSMYSKPKSKSYLSMARFLPRMANNVTQLNLCIEADYRREAVTPQHYLKVCHQLHFCTKLAEVTPHLESLTYTGRLCRAFFEAAAMRATPRLSKLRVINLTVKNTCRVMSELHESGSGIQDWKFIQHFEALVLAGIRSMEKLCSLEYLRIRHVDLGMFSIPANISRLDMMLTARCRLSMPAPESLFQLQERDLHRRVERPDPRRDAPRSPPSRL